MKIENIRLQRGSLANYQEIVDVCKKIIEENLQINGGTLKVADIFERDYNWSNLIIAIIDDQIVGFALVRTSNNMHSLKDADFYYYLSDIVVKRAFRNQGVGKKLLEEAINSTQSFPLVASALKDNLPSISLLSKFMTCFGSSESGQYVRFVDNDSYEQLYGSINISDGSSPKKPN